MASTTLSPNSSPSAVPPTTSTASSPPPASPPSSEPDVTTTVVLSPESQPNQTTGPSVPSPPSSSSAPPPQTSLPALPDGSPPAPVTATPSTPPLSSAIPISLPGSPPPAPVTTTPSTPPSSSALPISPPVLSPPPALPTSPPPSPTTSPPVAATGSPLSPGVTPSPPVITSPPPQPTVVASPPPPQTVSLSPPSPADVPITPSTDLLPPPVAKPSESSPPPPKVTSPPSSSLSSTPPAKPNSPPPPLSTLPSPPPLSTLPSSPPSVPSNLPPPAVLTPAPPDNPSTIGSPTSLPFPSLPTEKPIARETNGNNDPLNARYAGKGGLNTGGAVAIGVAVCFVASFLVMAVWFVWKQKRRQGRPNVGSHVPSPFATSQNSDSLFLKQHSPAPRGGSPSGSDFIYSPSEPGFVNHSKSWFTYEELLQATSGFSTRNLLGEGGFGCVYKGILVDEREIAVKQLKIGGSQGEREFRAEVEIISRVHHRHLVSLVGYCISEHQRLLVYDYLPNNTLHYHLHREGQPLLNWATRVRVAAGAARGIAYLHEDCHPRIIHRDIKSSNILLDNNFEARVSDFGLAKIALELDSNTHVSTRVMGTFGYMAPEYATSGKLTEKSDVYSYGVVLLELITGRKPVDESQPLGDESLVEWARPLLTEALEIEDFDALVDPRLEKNFVASEMFRMMEAAAACVRHSAARRPRMSQVVRALDSVDQFSDLSNGMKPGQSEIFNSREHSAQIKMFQKMAFGSQDYSSGFFNQSQRSWRNRDNQSHSSRRSQDGDNAAFYP